MLFGLGAVAHACNPALWEVEVGGLPDVRSSRPAWPTWWNPVSTTNTKKLGVGAGACNPSYSGAWGSRIAWTWEVEVAVSWDCTIALQPGWQEWNFVSKQQQQKPKTQNRLWGRFQVKCMYILNITATKMEMLMSFLKERGKKIHWPPKWF